ncbi:Pycsar system effector family protein [Rhodococcus aetherivorans]|uniref:Pycsar system effector family protein n=1 Tax=Rhodococcus aetherivorans TaxID=191292 RepID=UPI00388F4BB3
MATDPVDTAWKIHAAVTDWTAKVDTKASFALTIESALLVGVVTLSGEGRVFHHLSGWAVVWYVLGIALLIAGVVCAAWVVRPRLRSANLEAESHSNYIYFGHLQHLTPDAIQNHLESSEVLPVLSKQLREMSKIAWTKHRLVQLSMSLAPFGVVALSICATY